MVLAAVEEEKVSSDACGTSYEGQEYRHLWGLLRIGSSRCEDQLITSRNKDPRRDKYPNLLNRKAGLRARSCGFDKSVICDATTRNHMSENGNNRK
jgi:hypothetical protein